MTLTEWSVTAPAVVGTGEVRFDVRNDGGTVHQLAIYRGGALSGDVIEGGELVARTGNIQTGRTDALQAFLESGDYWLVCPIPGHTATGMSAQLTVDGSASPVTPADSPPAEPPEPGGGGGLFVAIGTLALLLAAGGAAAIIGLRRRGA